jgi:hypothetical protein
MPATIKTSPAPSHKQEVLKIVPTEAVEETAGDGVRLTTGLSGVGSRVCPSCTPGGASEVGEALGTTNVRVGLLAVGSTGVGVAGSVGKGVPLPAGTVEVASGVGVAVLAPVAVAGAVVPVGWPVGAVEGEAVGAGTAVSDGSSDGLVVGGSAVGPSVDGVVGTPDGVSVGMV